jgi:Fur family transcriptional regulator, ferric uptake regulator
MPSSAAHRVSSGERIHVDSRPGRLEKALTKKGVRLTRQRRVLLQVMDRAERHLAADEILERAQRVDSHVHRVTVYRTLDLLKRHRLRDHIHVACLRCGKVREFESSLFEQLKRQIAHDCGIEISVTRTEVGGVCNNCRASA